MPQYKVMFVRFPFLRSEDPDGVDWLVETVIQAKADPRISQVLHWRKDDTPIPMSRNKAVQRAKQNGVDYLLMLDSDMSPDIPGAGAKPFWKTSLDFMLQHQGPCVIAAPYCGPPPHENVYVFRWANYRSGNPNTDLRIEQFSREDAAQRGGFEEVAALPTGLILVDMRAIKALTPPYFYYEYTDEYQTDKASTEDVTFTRDLSLAGVPIYVNWDSWAGHWKRICVGKPAPLTVDQVRGKFADAVLRNQRSDEQLVMVGEGEVGNDRSRGLERLA